MLPISSKPSRLLMAVVCALGFFQGSSQILVGSPASIWLQPKADVNPATLQNGSIGNYSTLDLSNNQVLEKLQALAAKNSGTLFLVLKSRESTPDEALLDLGKVRIFEDQAVVAGREIPIRSVVGEAGLVRVTYQGKVRRSAKLRVPKVNKALQLAEVVFYDKILDNNQARIVESYLAMKYSINITSNEDEELRNYVDIYDNKAWNVASDVQFDEEVLALGRLDRIGFYQSQTFTQDSRSIRFSLEPSAILGNMPLKTLDDRSLLLLSKKVQQPPNGGSDCGSAAFTTPWKLRFVNWNSTVENLYLELDTALSSLRGAVLSDGLNHTPLQLELGENNTLVTIPLPEKVDPSASYYISWLDASNGCKPHCEILLSSCESTEIPPYSAMFKVQPEALPAQLTLTSDNGETYLEQTLVSEFYLLEHLRPGTYQIHISNEVMELSDRIFVVEECGNEPINTELGASLSALANATTAAAFSKNADLSDGEHQLQDLFDLPVIRVFPNPADRDSKVTFEFLRLEGQEVQIEVFDPSGKQIDSRSFTPGEYQSSMEYSFPMDGAYTIRFTTADMTEHQSIIIH